MVARIGSFAFATTVALVMTTASLLVVLGLTRAFAPHDREVRRDDAIASVPVAAPPPDEPAPSPDRLRPPESSSRAEASQSAPTPRAPSSQPRGPAAPGSVSAPDGLGSMAIDLTGGLPSVGGMPASAFATDDPPSDKPTTVARPTHQPAPQYPALAQRRGIEGHVTLRVRVDERGRVTSSVVVASEPSGVFDAAAQAALRQWRFTPARTGTQPVASTLEKTIRFELHR